MPWGKRPRPIREHGTRQKYMVEKCRCALCRKVVADYTRKYDQDNRQHRRSRSRELRSLLRVEVLSHYGPNGKFRCAWDGCDVTDFDMLTLDHVNNDGHLETKGGTQKYAQLKAQDYPSGYQTLCCNHQMKKEMTRRREIFRNDAYPR